MVAVGPYSTFCCCVFRVWRHCANPKLNPNPAPILLLFPMMLHTMFYTYHSRLHILPHLCRACRSGHSYYDTTADLTLLQLLHHKALLHTLPIQHIVWVHKGSQWKDFFFRMMIWKSLTDCHVHQTWAPYSKYWIRWSITINTDSGSCTVGLKQGVLWYEPI